MEAAADGEAGAPTAAAVAAETMPHIGHPGFGANAMGVLRSGRAQRHETGKEKERLGKTSEQNEEAEQGACDGRAR